MLSFILESDIHYTIEGIRPDKRGHVKQIKELCIENHIDALIVAGDLTNNGWDGAHLGSWYYGGKNNQLEVLKNDFVQSLEMLVDIKLCVGNHDKYTPVKWLRQPVYRYVSNRQGGNRYYFDLKGVRFICMGEFPDIISRIYLRYWLSEERPNIIFFHYNLTGGFSNWFPNKDKEAFYRIISKKNKKGYPKYNILCICVGHLHETIENQWRGYRVINAGGSELLKVDYNGLDFSVQKIKSNEDI